MFRSRILRWPMDTFILIVILAVPVIVCAFLYFFFGFKGHGGQLRNKDWTLDPWSKNVKLDDPPVKGSILSFTWPNRDGVHTISKRLKSGALKEAGEMSITYSMSGHDPIWTSQNPELPAQLRLHIGGARLYSHGDFHRDLHLGEFQTLTVPFKPENWKTVDGVQCSYDQAHINMFWKAIEKSEVVAFIFGDEGGANAHGANLDGVKGGSADFRLIGFRPS